MTDAQKDFQALVRDYLTDRGKDPSDIVAADDYLLEAGGRILQLRLGDDGAMLLSTMIFYNDGKAEHLLAGPIAEFNAFHLFSGGYRLLVDEQRGSLYVEQELAIERFDAAGLRRHLEDFADRATSCARWYLAQVRERDSASTPEQGTIA